MAEQEFLFFTLIYVHNLSLYASLSFSYFLFFFLGIFIIYFVCCLFSGVFLPKKIYVLDTPVFVGVYENIPPGTCKTPTMLSIMKGCGRAVVSEGACQKSRPVCCHRSPLPKICGTVPRFSLRDGILVPTFPKRS